jgi:signal transduction histidine kinase
VRDDHELLLAGRQAGRQHEWPALAIVAGLGLGLLLAAPFADRPLQGTEALLPAYAAVVLIVDVIAATLLLAQFAVHGAVPLLVLAVGYLISGLTAVPWVMTFPGVLAETGLLGAGLQTTALIAAVRRLVFPTAVLVYAALQHRRQPAAVDPARVRPLVLLAVLGSLALTLVATWLAVAGEQLAPRFMVDQRAATATWTAVLYVSLLLTLAAAVLLLARRRRSLLDLWLLVTLAAFLSEIVLLGFLGAGVRFSLGWWAGRAFGLLAASVVMLALLAQTSTLYARLLQSLLAESRVQEARATMLEALAAALAHELNQPLASIVTSADAAARWLDRPEPDLREVLARLRRITADGHSAAAIIASLRRTFGRRASLHGPVDLAALVGEAVRLMRADARAAGVVVAVEIAPGLPPVRGDAVPLRQALLNLLANAVDAVAAVDGGPRSIRVTCVRSPAGVMIAVADTGVGLANDGQLFDAFHSTKPQGMGLGLMICRTVVEAHGGRVTARANTPRGAVFEIVLPVASPDAGEGGHG